MQINDVRANVEVKYGGFSKIYVDIEKTGPLERSLVWKDHLSIDPAISKSQKRNEK